MLIKRIEDCAKARGIAPATVTRKAVGNSRLYADLKRGVGNGPTLDVIERLMSFTSANPSDSKQRGAA